MAVFDNPNNLTNITQLLTTANDFSSGTLGIGIWLVVSFGSLFLTSLFNSKESLIASSFVSMIVAFFLTYLGLLGSPFLVLSVFLFVISLILSRYRGGATPV